MSDWRQDVRYAARQLRKSPGFTLTAMLTLALGVGSTAAVYSVIQSVLLQPLPYAEPDRLVGVAFTFPHERPNAEQAGTSADMVRESVKAFSSVAVMDDSGPSVNFSVDGGHAMQVTELRVSEGYFKTLGVTPALGRGFVAAEDRKGGGHVAVLSDGLWKRIFNRDPSIVGRTVRINQEPYTVVGVMPERFAVTAETAPGVMGTPDIWQPLQLGPEDPGYDGDNYEMIARLAQGVTIEQAQQQLNALQKPFYERYPNYKKWVDRGNVLHEFRAWKLQDVVVSGVRRSLLTVMGAVVAVLLVACLNLAGLMTARAMRRSREIALRTALGAKRGDLLRMILWEGLVLALCSAPLAVAVAMGSCQVLLHMSPLAIPALNGDVNTWSLAGMVLVVSIAACALFFVLPAWAVLRRKTSEMRLGGPSVGEAISHARISRALMVVQVALAMVLVSTASALLGTFVKLRALPSGVEQQQLTVFQVALKGSGYASTQKTTQFVATVLNQLRGAPGVKSAAAINGLPLDRGLNMGSYPTGRPELGRTVEFRSITPGYLHTMGITLLSGRDISESDRAGGDLVVMVGATAAKKWWPGRSPIGESVRIGNEHNWRIVGVVADVQQHSLVEDQGIVIYGPMAQLTDEFTGIINGWFTTSFAVKTAANVNLTKIAQQTVGQADAEIPIAKMTTMQAVIDRTVDEPRFFSLLASGFSGFAIVLTVIGLFGLLSYQVTQRTREIGVRMALGANRMTILRGFLLRGVMVAAVGVVLGIGADWLLKPVVTHLLTDAGVFDGSAHVATSAVQAGGMAAVAILLATLIASWLPARRAASIEPMQALRAE
jgi:putative ABC transport system permease protein